MRLIAILMKSLFASLSLLALTLGNGQITLAHGEPPPVARVVRQQSGPIVTFLPIVSTDGAPAETETEPTAPDSPVPDPHDGGDYALAEAARQRNEPPFVADGLERTDAGENVSGAWGPVVTWPFVFQAIAGLPDGRILAWGGNNATSFNGGTNTFAAVWTPDTTQFQSVNHSDHSMFCAIPTMLEDGTVFANGGDGTRNRASSFNYRSNVWSRRQDMSVGRWYNGAVALPNGKVFTINGDPGGPYPELWSPTTGWSLLTGANLNNGILNFGGYQSSWLPYLHLAPNGQIFHSGPTQQMNWLNPAGNGAITNAGLNNAWYPKYGSAVMYAEGKILVAGGQIGGDNLTATDRAMMLDLNGPTPQKTDIAPMAFSRKFNNGVVLPTGEVLIIGGNSTGTEFSDIGTRLAAEIWNPDTRAWRTVASMSVPRNYHSVATLMPDGRVFSGGGGLCACNADHPNHQIFSPPYLFNADGSAATRPSMVSAPGVVGYGGSFLVQGSAGISKFNLIKMSGTTHNLNSDLRLISVPFSSTIAGQYQLSVPANQNVLTPGYWMLFAVNGAGVPSVAKVIQVVSNPPSDPNPRYVKLEATSEINGNVWTSAAEFNVLDANGNALARNGWLASADSAEPGDGLAANAIDGNTGTMWHTAWRTSNPPPPHALTLDMGSARGVGGFRYLPRQDGGVNGRIAGYRFYTSTNGVNWMLMAQGTFPNDVSEKTVRFGAAPLVINALAASPPKVINVPIAYTTGSSNGQNPRYKWIWGDGSPETTFTASANASHSFAAPGMYVIKAVATDDRGVEQTTQLVQAVHLPNTAARPTASSNIAYETRSGANNRVWAVNQDNDTVSVFDAVTNLKAAEIAVGKAPRSIAIAPNGNVWVTNKAAATLSVINPATLAVVQTIALPFASAPFGVTFAPNGSAAFIALEAAGRILRLDPANAAVLASTEVGQNVRHVSVNADSSKLYVSRFISPRVPGENTATPTVGTAGGEVLVLNASSLTTIKTVLLRHSDKPDIESAGRGLPNYLGAVGISPDGTSAWVPSKQDNILRGTLRDGNNLNFQNSVRAISSRLALDTDSEDHASRMDHDNAGVPSAVVYDRSGSYMFVALETNREVAVIDVYGMRQLARLQVGRAPQGLALSADGSRLYVHNFMDRSISVIDIALIINQGGTAGTTLATYNLITSEKLSAPALQGKQFFYDARDTRLAKDSYISCASCHNDGGQDGRVWDLSGFGEGLRNTIGLQGRAGTGHGFLHWSANFDEVQDFEGQIRTLAGGSGLMTDAQFNAGSTSQPLGTRKSGISPDLDALASYLNSLTSFASSPRRNADGTLTADAASGRAIFLSKNCAQCHGGNTFSSSGNTTLFNIGTLKPASGLRLNAALAGIDPPTLRDAWASAPYLHDGSAATLGDAIQAHNGITFIGNEVAQLAAYVAQIGDQEISAPSPNQSPLVTISAPLNGAVFNTPVTVTVSASATDADGNIVRVEFYNGGVLLGTDTSAPFAVGVANMAAGAYQVTARAYDNLGAVSSSAAVTITVQNAGSGTGLTAYYFNNTTLTGKPALERVEAVNFVWNSNAPGSGVNADNFSVRWIGQVEAAVTGSYQFQTVSDDGIRLWVNGTQVINNWTDHGPTTDNSASINLSAGVKYKIALEYYEKTGGATARLLWKTPAATTFVPIPANRLYALGTGGSFDTSWNYTLVSQRSVLCINVPNGSLSNLTQLQQAACNGSNSQTFKFNSVAGKSGVYTFYNLNSSKCVDVNGASQTDGGQVVQYSCGGGTNQQWRLNHQGGGIYELVAQHSNKCMYLANGSSLAGTNIQQWTCNGATAQRFQLIAR